MESIEAIRLFVAVAEEQGFAPAARRLRMSGASATRKIAALEDALQTRLFARSTRRVRLTSEGETYLDHARAICDAIDASHDALASADSNPRGRVRVTSRTSIGLRLIVPYVCEFRARYPDVEVGLELTDTPLDIVAEGFDCALAMGHLESSSLVGRTLAVTDSLVCASPRYLERHGTPRDPRALKDHACLSFQARSGRNTWRFSRGGQRIDVRIDAPIAINNGDALKRLALDGLGIVLVTDWLVSDEIASGELVHLFADFAIEPVGTPIVALYPSRTHLPAKVRVFVDFLAEKARLVLGAK